MQRRALDQAPDGEKGPKNRTVGTDGFHRVLRAGRRKTAAAGWPEYDRQDR